ncbi:Double-strand-break repair protein rad21 [Tyrophagus putrescentiae]|nr:Double-strand-break repair protein rad21 [Tyrophagus putrescentiae]
MFYIPTILGKRGPLAKLWLAAHDGRRLTRAQIMEVDVPGAVELFHQHDSLTSLRVQGDLLPPAAGQPGEGGGSTASTSRQRPGLGAVTAGEQAALTALIHTVEPVFEEEDFQLRLDQVIPEDGVDDDPNFTANVEVSAEELARRRRNVTMEEEELVVVPPGDPATADHLDHTDNLGGPIDMDDSGVGGGGGGGGGPARKGVVQPSDLLDGSFNLAGQSVSEINRLVNSATVDPTLDDPTLDQSHQDQDQHAPSIDRHPVNGEAARKRLRPAADNAAVPPAQAAEPAPPLVLEELTPRQIAAARRDGRQPGPRPARPRAGAAGLVIPAVIDNRPGRHLVIDRVIRIPDADFRAQLAQPRVHTAPVDFPVVEDGDAGGKTCWREKEVGPVDRRPPPPCERSTGSASPWPALAVPRPPSSRAPKRKKKLEATLTWIPSYSPIFQRTTMTLVGGLGASMATLPRSPVVGIQYPPRSPPPPPADHAGFDNDDHGLNQQPPPPPPMEENFSDRGDDRPGDTSTIGDARRSHRLHQQSSSRMATADEHAQLESAIIAQATLNLSAMGATERLPFRQFVGKSAGAGGGGVGRRVAAMTFLNLLARHDQQQQQQQQAGGEGAFLEQEPSYERFNTLYVRRARE